MKLSHVHETIDTDYKDGKAICRCGWVDDLGDGFNEYHIDSCPDCEPKLETRCQRKVITGFKNNYNVSLGKHIYFVLDNGIHLLYEKQVSSRHTALSLRRADNM